MSNFYTNVQSIGGNILYRGIVNDRRVKQKIEYSPSLYLPSKREQAQFKNLEGEPLEQKIFGNILGLLRLASNVITAFICQRSCS